MSDMSEYDFGIDNVPVTSFMWVVCQMCFPQLNAVPLCKVKHKCVIRFYEKIAQITRWLKHVVLNACWHQLFGIPI